MARIVDLVRPEVAFDRETIGVLSAALEEDWDRLLQSESEFPSARVRRAMREVVARPIVEMAQRGTTDQKTCQWCGSFSRCELST